MHPLKSLMLSTSALLAALILHSPAAYAYDAFPLAEEWQPPISFPGDAEIQIDTDLTGNWVGLWSESAAGSDKLAPVVSRSINAGHTWAAPAPIWPTGADFPSWKVTSLAAGDSGVWMATLHSAADSFDRSPALIKSLDGGVTWSAPLYLDQFLPANGPLTSGSYNQPLPLQVGYCGNSCWAILIAGRTGIVILRSSDDGANWSVQSTKTGVSAQFVGKPGATECLLMTRSVQVETTPQIAVFTTVSFEFSYDNGATFAPALNFIKEGNIQAIASTTGAGEWVVAVNGNGVENQIHLLYSNDHGMTFSNIGSTPQGFKNPNSLAYSQGGDLVIFAQETRGPADAYPQIYYGYTTRSSDNGITWTPWARVYSTEKFGSNDRYVGGSVDVEVDNANNFVAAGRSGSKNFWDQRPEEQPRMMQVFHFQGTQPAGAIGWELYE